MSILSTPEEWSNNTYENSSCKKMIFLNVSIVTTSHPKKIIVKHIKQQSIIKIIFLNALSVINMCPEYGDLEKDFKTVLDSSWKR